jgi:hypothetical protein
MTFEWFQYLHSLHFISFFKDKDVCFVEFVQRNLLTKTATRKDVEIEFSKWLAGSRDCDGGRKARNKVFETLPEANEGSD